MKPKTLEETHEMSKIPYKETVDSLLYASQDTRHDISFAIGCVSRYMQNPGKGHWMAVKRIFRYLKDTVGTKLEYSHNTEGEFGECHGYCDADWVYKSDSRRSITGSIFQGGPIVWQSKRQSFVALSTTEAEYMALSATCQEGL